MGQFGGQVPTAAARPSLALLAYVLVAGGGTIALVARQERAR
ncbi:hypothetical protein [Sphingomonas sediminicola]|nr:hypothetical protein [Sphingomonas sediminicola]